MSASEPKLNPDCPCPYTDCPRNQNCEACKENHHSEGKQTYCEKQEDGA